MIRLDTDTRETLIAAIAEFTAMTAIWLPDDVEDALRGLAEQETDDMAKAMYGCVLDNIEQAKVLRRPICQDTGAMQFFVEVGEDFPCPGEIKGVLTEAARKATAETPLRPNVVDPFGEKNTGDNTGLGAPYINFDIAEGSDLRIRLYLAGGGCSMPGRSKVLLPLEGVQGIRRFVCETIAEWGINACPPLCVGIGLGTCAVTSAELSKKALLRPLGTHNPDPRAAELEEQLQKDLNAIGFAPLGFGGCASVLGVNVEFAGRHPATLGVGLSTSCWATRRGEMVVHKDLSTEILSHARAREQRRQEGHTYFPGKGFHT